MTALSPLEFAVGSAIAAQPECHDEAALVAQLRSAHVTLREFTGFGFFTEFEVDKSLSKTEAHQSPFGRLHAEVGPDGYLMGFMVYLKDGFAEMIEGYSYGDGYGDLDLLTADFTPPSSFV
jgi:hypothetical protein